MKRVFAALFVCVAFLFVGCVDREFDLSDVSGEVTIGGEELVVPLATVDKISLADIIESNDVISNDENGVYQIKFADEGNVEVAGIEIPSLTNLSPKIDPVTFDVASLPTSITLDDMKKFYEFEFPTIQDAVHIDPIEIVEQVNINLPSSLSGVGTLPDALANMIPNLTSSYSNTASFKASLQIMKELDKIDFVEFGSDELPGAEFAVDIELGGIAGINGGGELNVYLKFPEGYYFCDENGTPFPQETHNIFSRNVKINKGDDKISLKLYLQRISYIQHTFVDGKLNIDDTIEYGYDLDIKPCGGQFNLNSEYLPKLHIKATPVYKDIEVVIKHFELDHLKYDVQYEFAGIPKEVEVKKLAFNNSSVTFSMTGLEWLVARDNITNEQFAPSMEIILPSCMHFHSNEYINENVLIANVKDLSKGITLNLDYIDCQDKSITRKGDTIVIDSAIETIIHLESLDGHTVFVSDLLPETNPIKIEFAMSNMHFNVDVANSEVVWGEDLVLSLDLNEQMPTLSQEVEIPSMIASIESIAIAKANSNGEPVGINLSLGTLNNSPFPVGEIDIDVFVNLGKMLRPTKNCLDSSVITKDVNGNYILKIKQLWEPNKAPLTANLEFEALENLPAVVDGKIKIDQIISIERCSATIKGGQNIDLSAIDDVAIDVKMHIDDIEISKFRGCVDIAIAPEEMVVELEDMSNLGVAIETLSLNPILKLNLKENPTGEPLFANVALKTFNAKGDQLFDLNISDVQINGTGATNLVISTPKNRGKFEGTGVTFIEVYNLSDLLSNGIPAKIAVNLSVTTNKNEIYEIDLLRAKQGYNIEYDYEVLVPFEFDNVKLTYESVMGGMNETFATLANDMSGLKVGDIGLVAEFGTTIPFNIRLSAELVNVDGTTNNVEAKLRISNGGLIEGWTEADGLNPHISKLDLDFDLGSSHSLTSLKNVDGVKLKFTLTDTGSDKSSSLANIQYLTGNLKLRVRDGLTIDIFDLIGKEE